MTAQKVQRLSDAAVMTLHQIADQRPTLFTNNNPDALQKETESRLNDMEGNDTDLFQPGIVHHVAKPFLSITSNPAKGPSHDADHAISLREILPKLTAAEASDERWLTSINCFHLAGFHRVRWGLSKNAGSGSRSKFVKEHLLGSDKESNTTARLWWLYELSQRAAPYSKRDRNELLSQMAGNVGFYHQMLFRRYLMASDRIRAFICDASQASGMMETTGLKDKTNKMLQRLNRVAGGVSLDSLNDETLRDYIKQAMHPKEGAALQH